MVKKQMKHVSVWVGIETDQRPGDILLRDDAVSARLDSDGFVEVSGAVCGEIRSGHEHERVGFGMEMLSAENPTDDAVATALVDGEMFVDMLQEAFGTWGLRARVDVRQHTDTWETCGFSG